MAALGDHGVTAVTLQREAAVALGKIADGRALEPLVTALDDESDYVRQAAVRALERIGGAPAASLERAPSPKGFVYSVAPLSPRKLQEDVFQAARRVANVQVSQQSLLVS
jgi:HEAT repeat protein